MFPPMLAQGTDASFFQSDRKFEFFVETHKAGIITLPEHCQLIARESDEFIQDLIYSRRQLLASFALG